MNTFHAALWSTLPTTNESRYSNRNKAMNIKKMIVLLHLRRHRPPLIHRNELNVLLKLNKDIIAVMGNF